MKRIKLDADHFLKVQQQENNRLFISVFRNNETTPLIGTETKAQPNEELKRQGLEMIQQHKNNQSIF